MDDFLSAQLDQDYLGCKVQEWNGRKSLWCLCDGDLCNGKSMKNLFYYGYGSPSQGQAEPEGKSYQLETHEDKFDAMTGSLDNYNAHYAIEPRSAEAGAVDVEEPLGPVELEENVAVRVDDEHQEGAYGDYQTDQPQAYDEQDPSYIEQLPEEYSEPHLEEHAKQDTYDQTYAPEKEQPAYVEPKTYESEPQPKAYEEQPQENEQEGKQEGYTEHHHPGYPEQLPVFPGPYGEQYLPARFLNQQVRLPPYFPAYHGYPMPNAQQKYHGEKEAQGYPNEDQQEEEKKPEAKSAEAKGYPHPLFYNYPYQYQNGPAEINLEPVSYFPYEHPDQANHGGAPQEEKSAQVATTEASSPGKHTTNVFKVERYM